MTSSGWSVSNNATALADATMTTSTRYAQVTHTFSGSAFAWVAPTGRTRGRAVVFVDGVKVATVSLHSATFQPRTVVFARRWDPTVTWVRHCTSCGAIDDSERWGTKEEALASGVGDRPWACPACGADGFEIKPVARTGGG